MPVTFRKSIPIVPKILFLNINRRSWSISLRLGPLAPHMGQQGHHHERGSAGPVGLPAHPAAQPRPLNCQQRRAPWTRS